MKTNKNTHTLEEIEELNTWFEENKSRIPAGMHINTSTYSPNLEETIKRLLEQAYTCYNNPKMQGCILLLKQIQKKLTDNND